jgi:acetyl esterase/lipase
MATTCEGAVKYLSRPLETGSVGARDGECVPHRAGRQRAKVESPRRSPMSDATAGDTFERAVDVERDVVFRETPARDLRLDDYRPGDGGAASTGLVFVHGGGWSKRARGQFAGQAAVLSTLGYRCVAIEYRLSEEAPYPAALADVAAGVEWMRSRDVDRVGLLGGSAGGHLAALVALAPGLVGADVTVDALALFNPVLDLVPEQAGDLSDSRRAFLGVDYATDPERYERASPLTYVREMDRSRGAEPQSPPPTLICHGTADEVALFETSERFCEAFRADGVRADLFAAPGAGHAFFNETPWYERTFCEASAFLQAVCPARDGHRDRFGSR